MEKLSETEKKLILKMEFLVGRRFRSVETLKANITNRVLTVKRVEFAVVFIKDQNQVVLSVPSFGLRIIFNWKSIDNIFEKIIISYIILDKNPSNR